MKKIATLSLLAAVAFPLVACATPTGEPDDPQPTAPSAQAADGTPAPAAASAEEATRTDDVSDPIIPAVDDTAPSDEKSIDEMRAAGLVGEPGPAGGATSTSVATAPPRTTCLGAVYYAKAECNFGMEVSNCDPINSAPPCNYRHEYPVCAAGALRAIASCNAGLETFYRTWDGDTHREVLVPTLTSDTGERVEGVFRFATKPQPGAPAAPLYRCRTADGYSDYLSGKCLPGRMVSIAGYRFAPNTVGARPVYECRLGAEDYFLSRAANCEGRPLVAVLGWAK